jgi:hypothetical protein
MRKEAVGVFRISKSNPDTQQRNSMTERSPTRTSRISDGSELLQQFVSGLEDYKHKTVGFNIKSCLAISNC